MYAHERSTIISIVMIFIALQGLAFHGSLNAAELITPVTPGLFFQTNGPQSERNNGDWWTNKNGGDSLHVFEIIVPAIADPNFTLTVDLYDPESFDSGLDERDKRGGHTWDNTLFKLYAPTGATPIIEKNYIPGGGTNNSWVTLTSFKISDYGSGIYHLYSYTNVDDENYFRIRIPENDPDGIPLSGDEIQLRVLKSSIQFPNGGSTILWFYVAPGTPVINLYNFDMDSPVYTTKYIIHDPLNNSYLGKISLNDVWNTGLTTFPTSGGDQFLNPAPGWWHVEISLSINNQIIFYGVPWTDHPPQIMTGIGDYVWNDEDMDGIQDFNEDGVQGVTVNLLDSTGSVLDSQVSGPNGGYMFANLEPGKYRLDFIIPSAYQFTLRDQGANDNLDSDANPTSGRTVLFTLNENETQLNWDAGVMRKLIADMMIEKAVNGIDVMTGDTVQYTLTVTNLGPDPASNVRVLEDIPPGIQFISATPPQSLGPAPLQWNIPIMNSGQTNIIQFLARVTNLMGKITNIGMVTADNPDPNLLNNADSAFINVFVPVELSSFIARVENNSVKLEWITQSESETMGYYIFRKDSHEGGYKRITSAPIPAAGNSQVERRYVYIDNIDMSKGQTYSYKLADIALNGTMTMHESVTVNSNSPLSYELEQNYPNPFNMATTIRFQLRESDDVELLIFNMNGQAVRSLFKGKLAAGTHEIKWDGLNNHGQLVPSGNYIYSLKVNNFERMQKMILVK